MRKAPLAQTELNEMKWFYECGTCGHLHREGYMGDCRDDSQRFTQSELENKHGPLGGTWDFVPLDEQREAEASSHG